MENIFWIVMVMLMAFVTIVGLVFASWGVIRLAEWLYEVTSPE